MPCMCCCWQGLSLVHLLCHSSPGDRLTREAAPCSSGQCVAMGRCWRRPQWWCAAASACSETSSFASSFASCALPRSIPGSPRQATIPCQRDCDAAEGKLCHSLLGRPRRRCGHRLCHLTAGIQALSRGYWGPLSLITSMLPCQPFCCSLELLWHLPEDTSAVKQPLPGHPV